MSNVRRELAGGDPLPLYPGWTVPYSGCSLQDFPPGSSMATRYPDGTWSHRGLEWTYEKWFREVQERNLSEYQREAAVEAPRRISPLLGMHGRHYHPPHVHVNYPMMYTGPSYIAPAVYHHGGVDIHAEYQSDTTARTSSYMSRKANKVW